MTNDEKQRPSQVSRRQFVGTVATTAAGLTIVPRHVLGGVGFQAPSDTVNVAIVGYKHGMGTSNLLNVAKTDNVVALCDLDESEAAAQALKQRGTLEKVPKAILHKDFRVMLEKQKDIDAVLVATPDHTHAVIAMAAMQLGKHVYVQKPLTRTISEARALTEAARKYKVVTQMGNQGHSEEGLRLMQEWLEGGAIGQVREVHCWTNRPIWPQGIPRPAPRPADFPGVIVQCRTEPAATEGDCEAWALNVLADSQDLVPRTIELVLSGPLGPGHDGEQCTAEFLDAPGHRLGTRAVRCYVPSGG
jgi:hypothetical protein